MEEKMYNNTEPIPEEENDPDKNVTIGDINITSEMNTSNREESTENEEVANRVNDHYNL